MKKLEIVRSIVSILAADGKIVPQEKHFLINLCKRLKVSKDAVSTILAEAKEGNRELHIPTAPKEKQILYKLLIQAACSDGSVSPDEQELLESFAIQIGMTRNDVQTAIASYLQETLPQALQKRPSTQTALAINVQQEVLSAQILSWKDTHKTRIDEVLLEAFPRLESRLKDVVDEKAIAMLKGGPKKFTKELLEPEIIAWVKHYTEPLMHSAEEELTRIVTHSFEHSSQFPHGQLNAGGSTLSTDLLAPLVAVIAGIGTMVAGVMFSISSFLWFFTMINWPILIGGLVVGGVLSALGVVKLTRLKSQLLKRFTNIFLPKIRDALVGKGYEHEKQHYPSLSRQLQASIEQTAQTVLQQVRV